MNDTHAMEITKSLQQINHSLKTLIDTQTLVAFASLPGSVNNETQAALKKLRNSLGTRAQERFGAD